MSSSMRSHALYDTGQLRFWTEHQIKTREWFITDLSQRLQETLTGINKAWAFFRMEGPILTPRSQINAAYGEEDVWLTQRIAGAEMGALRPETTASSYLYAKMLQQKGQKPPFCVWQAGKSFRLETNDGASAAKLRFFEFWQLEFQCIYSKTTLADLRTPVEQCVTEFIGDACNTQQVRKVPSDRLPAYSEMTNDIEVERVNGRWTEMSSISTRTDYAPDMKVLEVAVGLDRLVEVAYER